MAEPNIKHMANPMGDSAVGNVKIFVTRLRDVIDKCPTVPDEAGRDSISKDNVLKMLDTLFSQYAEQLSSFDYDRNTGEKLKGSEGGR
jgi:hypothetical protein